MAWVPGRGDRAYGASEAPCLVASIWVRQFKASCKVLIFVWPGTGSYGTTYLCVAP